MTLGVRLDFKSLDDLAAAFPKGTASALNKVAASTKTAASEAIRQIYNIKKSDVDRGIGKLSKARADNLRASIHVRGPRLPLIYFAARQLKPGVSVNVKRASGRKLIPHAFIADMKSGHRGVYERRGKKRLPIREFFGPSIPQLFKGADVYKVMEAHATAKFNDTLIHEITHFMR